jgi:ribosomal-protein-alanine N-acetyltransferase
MSAVLKESALDYRPMQEADLPEIVEIERQSYPHPWTQIIFGDCLHAGYSSWVCGRNGVIEAYGILSAAAGEAHLLNICVRKESRQQGIGRKMLRHLVAIARRHETEMIFLEVRPSNVGRWRTRGCIDSCANPVGSPLFLWNPEDVLPVIR